LEIFTKTKTDQKVSAVTKTYINNMRKNSKISDFGGIPIMGKFVGFLWAKKFRQWLKLYFSSIRATHPKIRRAISAVTKTYINNMRKNSKISDFGDIPKMGKFVGFLWAKKFRQWLKLYFSSIRATHPKIRRAIRRPENYSIFALKYCTIEKDT